MLIVHERERSLLQSNLAVDRLVYCRMRRRQGKEDEAVEVGWDGEGGDVSILMRRIRCLISSWRGVMTRYVHHFEGWVARWCLPPK